jgi:hypothetical protein
MKGGNCCNFETMEGHCTAGPYVNYESGTKKVLNTKNIKQFCGVIDNVYVFFSFHAFKHMEELTLSCYDIEGLISKINEELQISYIAKSDDTTTATFMKEITDCDFGEENISEIPDDDIFVSFVLDIEEIEGICNYYVFRKIKHRKKDDIIEIFVLGNCSYTIDTDEETMIQTISYQPIYSNSRDDNLSAISDHATLVYSNLNKKDILAQYSGYKKTEELKSTASRAFFLRDAMHAPTRIDAASTRIDATSKMPTKFKKTRKVRQHSPTTKSVPTSPPGSLDTTEVTNNGYFKKYKITPANISRLERIMRNIDRDETIESAVIQFEDCHFQEVYPISSKVKIVNLIKCTGVPKFDENNIYELNIVEGTASLDANLQRWKLTTLRILFIKNKISFPVSLDKLGITELVIVNTIVQNINFWAKWPLEDLYLYYVAYTSLCVLPKIITLKNLNIYTAFELLDLRSIDKLTSCLIVSHREINLCDYLNTDFKRRIKLSNMVLANELKKANEGLSLESAKEFFQDISTTPLYATSDFQFSKEIIYNETSGFKCDCFSVSNINNVELLYQDDMVWTIMEKFIEKVNSSSPTH